MVPRVAGSSPVYHPRFILLSNGKNRYSPFNFCLLLAIFCENLTYFYMDIKIPTVSEVKQMMIKKYDAKDKDGAIEKMFYNVDYTGPLIETMAKVIHNINRSCMRSVALHNYPKIKLLKALQRTINVVLCSINIEEIIARKDMKTKALEERVSQLEVELKQKKGDF